MNARNELLQNKKDFTVPVLDVVARVCSNTRCLRTVHDCSYCGGANLETNPTALNTVFLIACGHLGCEVASSMPSRNSWNMEREYGFLLEA